MYSLTKMMLQVQGMPVSRMPARVSVALESCLIFVPALL